MRRIKKTRDKDTLQIACFMNFFPALSETFITNEVLGLRRRGLGIDIYAIDRPPAERENPELISMVDEACYIVPKMKAKKLISGHLFFLFRHPRRYLCTWFFAFKLRTRSESLLRSLWQLAVQKKELSKPQRQNMMLHFFLIPPVAQRMIGKQYDLVHAHFADSAAGLALLASMLLHRPFSFTAHAYDIFTPQVNFDKKLDRARFIVTCTNYNRQYLLEEYPGLDANKLLVNLHGIPLADFKSDRKKSDGVPLIVSVGRLVPKKGIAILVHACKLLKEQGIAFRCRIIGDGPERPRLEMQIRLNQLIDCVEIIGLMPPAEVKELYRETTLFVLPCIVDENGDRDGIPNVLAEAMAMEIPVISTRVSGIPELVENDVSGILMEQGDAEVLTQIIKDLFAAPARMTRLAKAGRQQVERMFDAEQNLDQLKDIFNTRMRS